MVSEMGSAHEGNPGSHAARSTVRQQEDRSKGNRISATLSPRTRGSGKSGRPMLSDIS